MSKYNEYKKKALSDSEVKREYDELQPEYDIIQAMIDARASQNITQKELSDRTGITQADISRIEHGTRNPSLAMMKKLAAGLGMLHMSTEKSVNRSLKIRSLLTWFGTCRIPSAGAVTT